ncbi:MAG: hypothetical protein WCR72_08115 [Bacteroidota bacterium]
MNTERTFEDFVQSETEYKAKCIARTNGNIARLTARLATATGSKSTRITALLQLHTDHLAEIQQSDVSVLAATRLEKQTAQIQLMETKRNEIQQRIQANNAKLNPKQV